MIASHSWRGDGHAVLLLPGFTLSDRSNLPLAAVARAAGCRPHGWNLGTNEGPTQRVIDGLDARLAQIADDSASPVSLVGVSLGGIYARMLARRHPTLVRQIISIGGPFRFRERNEAANMVDLLWRRRVHRFSVDALEEIRADEAHKPDLQAPATSIYSRFDNVVPWATCLEDDAPQRENVQVLANHVSLVLHPATHLAVADRLRQPVGEWQRFQPPLLLRPGYPKPDYYRHEVRS